MTVSGPRADHPQSPLPDQVGRFGAYGGNYVPETLHHALDLLTSAYEEARLDHTFHEELAQWQRHYVGRPTPLYLAKRLTEHTGGAAIYLKREDLAHTGAHKINNCIGQALLAVRMDKQRVIAETGAGQHGVATATAAAVLGLDCRVHMGTEDMRRQQPNVMRMQLLGASVVPATSGAGTLNDAVNAALRDWMQTSDHTHYIIGSVVGPHPFPMIVRDFQAVIGQECRQQCLADLGRVPDHVVACVGGGSNAAGIFHSFISDQTVQLTGVEAGGRSDDVGDHAATLCRGRRGILHGSLSYVLQDECGQTSPVHSLSAGLDYPGVGPEHAYWRDLERVQYTHVSDRAALHAFQLMSRLEGIIPALESAHAVAYALRAAAKMPRNHVLVVNLSGRGDKDLDEALRLLDAT